MDAMRRLTLLIFAAWPLLASWSSAESWPRFRGPNGAGLSDATTVPTQWTDDDYNWRVDLPGVGHSSPVVWERLLWVTCGDEATGKRMVLCFDTTDGRRLWSREFAAQPGRRHKLNSLASATPAVDRDRVYVCWANPDQFLVTALDHHGRDVWRRELGPFHSGHGDGVSPIVCQDLVVVPLQHNGDSRLVALDSADGRTRWQVACEPEAAWSTPCVLRRDEQTQLIFTNWKHGVMAVDPRTGDVAWHSDVFDKGHVEAAIGSPIVAGDLVLATCGWLGVRNEVVAIRPHTQDDGKTRVERVYCLDRNAPLCTTPLAKDGLLFLWSDEGVVTCADVASGKVEWRKRVGGSFYASPICVDRAIYNVSTDGEVVVLRAARAFEELARNALGEPSQATPAVADGVMYLRTVSRVYSIGGQAAR